MRRLAPTDVPSRIVTAGLRRQLVLTCLWLLTALAGCDDRVQIFLHFDMRDLVELDRLQLDPVDQDGKAIASRIVKSVPALLQQMAEQRAMGFEPTISIYLNREVHAPLTASVKFVGRGPADCMIAEGETTNVQVSESGQTLDVPLLFFPKLTLNQRSEKPPRPGQLRFGVSLVPNPGDESKPEPPACPSKTQPNTYYVPKSSTVRVKVYDADSFTVFDGWDDQDCGEKGECELERSQSIDTDSTWTAKFASWNCLQPDAFCQLEPPIERYQKPIADMSAMSAWVAPNRDIWVVGHRGTTQNVGPGIIMRWAGHEWIREAANIPTTGKRFWDIAGDSLMKNIVVVGDQIILHKNAGTWRDAGLSVWATGVWVGDKDGAWVTAKNAPGIVHHTLATGEEWSFIDNTAIKGLSSNLHSISGNDDGVIIATGARGTILRIEKKMRGFDVENVPNTYSVTPIYSSLWHAGTDKFVLAANDALFLVPSLVTSARPYVTGDWGTIFGIWLPPVQPAGKLECWTTGSYGTTRRWVLDPHMGPFDPSMAKEIPIPASNKISLRNLVGPDINYLWAVGYQRERQDNDLEKFEIKLMRYCPESVCTPH